MFALLRLLIYIGIIAAIAFGGMFALDQFVDPELTEQSETFVVRPNTDQ